MTTQTPTPPSIEHDGAPSSFLQTLILRITRLEVVIAAVIAVVLLVLVVLEPDILEAPFENSNTILFTLGGTVLAALAFVAMLWFKVPAVIRILVLVVPFAIVNWWLLSPYFIDDVVDEEFSTSIAAQLADPATDEPVAVDPTTPPAGGETTAETAPAASVAPPPTVAAGGEPASTAPAASDAPAATAAPATTAAPTTTAPPPPTEPVLLGAGEFVGLAGHDGTGVAGLFVNPDGSYTLRFEQFDIENGPDLKVYLVPGADQTSLPAGSIELGDLKGNIGDQNYEISADAGIAAGSWTALVWCEAFSVEFVGATISF